MNRSIAKGCIFAFVCVVFSVVCAMPGKSAAAQEFFTRPIPRTQAEREKAYRLEHRIRLNVSVTDASGEPVAGLSQANFTLRDDGKPAEIGTFHAVGPNRRAVARHVTLVIDGINSNSSIGRVQKALEKFLSPQLGPLPFPTDLAVLSDKGVALSDPSTDRSVLAGDLKRMTKRVQGMNCDAPQGGSDLMGYGQGLYPGRKKGDESCAAQRFTFSLGLLQKLIENSANAKGRGILIWLGSGWSVPRPRPSEHLLPGAVRDNFADPIATVRTELREANVTLDAVSWSNFAKADSLRDSKVGTGSKPASIADLALPALVRDSGGVAIARSENIDAALNSCLADTAQFYALTFDSKPSAKPDEFHRVAVSVDQPGATVRTLTGYYAQP